MFRVAVLLSLMMGLVVYQGCGVGDEEVDYKYAITIVNDSYLTVKVYDRPYVALNLTLESGEEGIIRRAYSRLTIICKNVALVKFVDEVVAEGEVDMLTDTEWHVADHFTSMGRLLNWQAKP